MRGPLLAHAGAPSESSTDVQSESAVSGAGSAVAITPRLGLADPVAHGALPRRSDWVMLTLAEAPCLDLSARPQLDLGHVFQSWVGETPIRLRYRATG